METTSELIQRRLKELNMSKSDLAKKVGVSRAYIGDLANGTAKTRNGSYKPSPEILANLVKALQITEAEFFASLGYAAQNSTTSDFDEKVRVAFQGAEGLPEEEIDRLLQSVRTFVAGVRAERAAKENSQ